MLAARKCFLHGLAIAATVATLAVLQEPADASTFVRQSLQDLVANNTIIVVGEVVETWSYWNEKGTFILTDARIVTQEVLKGKLKSQEIVVTVPGGMVGGQTVMIVGGARLVPGKSYVLFLKRKSPLGVKDVLTVADHEQGVFEIVQGEDGLRAISQADGHRLMPDRVGEHSAPGGREGLPLDSMKHAVREIAGGLQAVEVQR